MDSKDGPVRRFTSAQRDIDSIVETLVVLHGNRDALELEELNSYFTPIAGKRKLKGKSNSDIEHLKLKDKSRS